MASILQADDQRRQSSTAAAPAPPAPARAPSPPPAPAHVAPSAPPSVASSYTSRVSSSAFSGSARNSTDRAAPAIEMYSLAILSSSSNANNSSNDGSGDGSDRSSVVDETTVQEGHRRNRVGAIAGGNTGIFRGNAVLATAERVQGAVDAANRGEAWDDQGMEERVERVGMEDDGMVEGEEAPENGFWRSLCGCW